MLKPLLVALAATCAGLLLWRQASLESELIELRRTIMAPDFASRFVPAPAASSVPDPAPTTAPVEPAGALAETQQRLEEAQEKIAALEQNLNELTDAWNQFADDEAMKRKRAAMRSWGPEQITGAPDSPLPGDRQTAWASSKADGGMEWLQADFAQPAEAAQVRVLENDNPGAVVKITGFLESGAEVVLWEGNEPRPPAPADQVFNVPPGYRVRSVRVHLDTAKVPGWNEIDAVELIARDGSRQWASGASASSTYASPQTVSEFDGTTGIPGDLLSN